MFKPRPGMCQRCGRVTPTEKHDPGARGCKGGYISLCHFCHMLEDGRLVMMYMRLSREAAA